MKENVMNEIKADILIAGGGSAGFGAAYNACKMSNGRYSIALVDSNITPGGTSVYGGVNCWEMGIGGPGVHRILAERLLAKDGKAAILKGNWKTLIKERPYAMASPDNRFSYNDTLRAAGIHDRINNHNSFIFEPGAMAVEMLKLLNEAGKGKFIFLGNEKISEVKTTANGRLESVKTDKNSIKAEFFIDCTGDDIIANMAGCDVVLEKNLNGVTQVYRVEQTEKAYIEQLPEKYELPYKDIPFEKRLDRVRVISSINKYPNGDLNINQLPTMDGDDFFDLPFGEAVSICIGRVYIHWNRMQQDVPVMRSYKLKHIFPMIGIREGYRLKGEYLLNESDLLAGFTKQNRADEVIAFSDHPVDIHGGDSTGIQILDKPYGIPYGCMVTKEVTNLLVASRGSSFNHTAAASCRLSRTMIALGEAAGTAAVHCLDKKVEAGDADISAIRNSLGIPAFSHELAKEFDL